jgi:mRNA interferase YafQ
MIRKPAFSNRFEKDMEACQKRNLDLTKIKAIMFDLICGKTLPSANNDHKLKGNMAEWRECHIAPNWLLTYKLLDDKIIFDATGPHNKIFNNHN